MKAASCGSSEPKSVKSGSKFDWFKVYSVFLEPDPGKRQRSREISLDSVYWSDPGKRIRTQVPASLYINGPREAELSAFLTDFVAAWLAENVPMREARALADMLGSRMTLREAGAKHGVDFRRLSEHRRALAVAVKEAL